MVAMRDPLEWSELPHVDRGKYLGYLIAVAVTATEVFASAHRKALKP